MALWKVGEAFRGDCLFDSCSAPFAGGGCLPLFVGLTNNILLGLPSLRDTDLGGEAFCCLCFQIELFLLLRKLLTF